MKALAGLALVALGVFAVVGVAMLSQSRQSDLSYVVNPTVINNNTYYNITGGLATDGNWTYDNGTAIFWNQTKGDARYLQSYTESDPFWTSNYTAYNSTWSDRTNASYYLASNPSSYISSVASDSTWTLHNSYPSACAAGQYATTIGDALTCSAPSSLGYLTTVAALPWANVTKPSDCAAGTAAYGIDGASLECIDVYDATDDQAGDCTEVNACTIDAESMEGTDWGTMSASKWCMYDGSSTEVDCNVEPVVDTDTPDDDSEVPDNITIYGSQNITLTGSANLTVSSAIYIGGPTGWKLYVNGTGYLVAQDV